MLARRRYIFGGHPDARWSLSTTLDRFVQQSGVSDRVTAQQMLLAEFAKEAVGIVDPRLAMAEHQMRLELLARHRGLPTTILDWTRSPYVAAFFAFGGIPAAHAVELEKVAIWRLDLSLLDARDTAGVAEVIEVQGGAARGTLPRWRGWSGPSGSLPRREGPRCACGRCCGIEPGVGRGVRGAGMT